MRTARPVPRAGSAFAAVSALVTLGACGAQAEPAEVAAEAFYAAVTASDWSAACDLLAPSTRSELEQSTGSACPQALAEEDLPDPGPVVQSTRYGTMAQTRSGGDTVFMSRFGQHWRVVAVGCAPVPGRPYDCRLEGG